MRGNAASTESLKQASVAELAPALWVNFATGINTEIAGLLEIEALKVSRTSTRRSNVSGQIHLIAAVSGCFTPLEPNTQRSQTTVTGSRVFETFNEHRNRHDSTFSPVLFQRDRQNKSGVFRAET